MHHGPCTRHDSWCGTQSLLTPFPPPPPLSLQIQQLLGLIGDYTPAGTAGTITANLQQDDSEIVFQGGFVTPSARPGAGPGEGAGGVGTSAAGDGDPNAMPAGAPGARHSSKVGWLKLRAALRWGIFIRKRAAERRAQIVQLDDDDDVDADL